jgi:hypothetical protein
VYTPGGEIRVAERVAVDAHSRQLRAAADGESIMLETPIEFTIEPLALRVLLPRRPDS